MSSDIVTRLRNAEAPRDGSELLCDLADEAADEIKRLRNALEQCEAERDTWKTTLTDEIKRLRRAIETFINVYYNCYTTREIESLAIEELKQAVRGE